MVPSAASPATRDPVLCYHLALHAEPSPIGGFGARVRDGGRHERPRRRRGRLEQEESMPRVCAVTGKKTRSITTSKRKGSPKKRGGVGVKQVGVHKRQVKPNLQKRTIWVDGKPQKVWLSAKAMKAMDPTLFVNPNK
jgi:large subunit ribosomal protein L28